MECTGTRGRDAHKSPQKWPSFSVSCVRFWERHEYNQPTQVSATPCHLKSPIKNVYQKFQVRWLFGDFEQLILLGLIIENLGIYLKEIQSKLSDIFGVEISAPTICRTLKMMGCSFQKIEHIALQHCEEQRAKFMAEVTIHVFDPAMLVWIDKMGWNRQNSMRRYGYSVRGIPPLDHRLLVHVVRCSGIAMVSLENIHDIQIVEGSANGAKFEEFIWIHLMILKVCHL